MRKRRIGMVQAEPRPAGSLRRRRGARPAAGSAQLWRRCPSSPGLNFSSLSLHQHHVTSAHAIGWQLYPDLHIHGGARAGGSKGVTAGARAPHLSHTHTHRERARPAPLRGPPPRAAGAAPPGPSRAGTSQSLPVPIPIPIPNPNPNPVVCPRYFPVPAAEVAAPPPRTSPPPLPQPGPRALDGGAAPRG